MSAAHEPNPAPARGPDSIRRSLSWTLFGELSFAAAQWFSLVIMAKLGSAEALGRYSLGLAIATPIVIFANLHLRPIYVVDTRSRWGFADFLGLRTLLLPFALVVVAMVCLARGWAWETAAAVMFVAVVRVSEGASDIYYARAQRAENMDPIGISRALRGLGSLALLTAGLLIADDVVALALVAVAMVLFTFGYDRRSAAKVEIPEDPTGTSMRPRFDRSALISLTREALPIGIAAGLLGLSANTPAYLLEDTHGLEAVGILAALLSIRQASGIVNMALGNAAIARLAKLSVADPRGFWRLLAKLMVLVLVLNGLGVVAVAVAGDLYLRYGFAPEYAAYLPQLVVASIAAVIVGLANILSQTLTALSQFRAQLWINVAVLILTGAIAWWLIPTRGIDGAVETFLISSCVRLLIYVVANLWFGPKLPSSVSSASSASSAGASE